MYICWYCNAATREPPCDADGTGETGMVWPSACFRCCEDSKPVRAEAHRDRFPDTKVSLVARSGSNQAKQAYYLIMRQRGHTDMSKVIKKAKA